MTNVRFILSRSLFGAKAAIMALVGMLLVLPLSLQGEEWADISDSVQVTLSRPLYNFADRLSYLQVSLLNGLAPQSAPIHLVITSVTTAQVTVYNADGLTTDGHPYFDFSGHLGDGELAPGESSSPRQIEFSNPQRLRFSFTTQVRVENTLSTNQAPIADADADQTALIGDTVTLDGSASTDRDGDTLSYAWSLNAPADSSAILSDPDAIRPTFDIDLPGTYVAQLMVNDGRSDSAPDTVTVSTLNSHPVAHAGPDQTVFIGDAVSLDGSASTDVDGDTLSYTWSLSTPKDSVASLSDPDAMDPAFDVDLPGSYVAQLMVNDGIHDSAPDAVTFSTLNSPPVAHAGPDQTVSVGDSVSLDGNASTDVDGETLSYVWSLLSTPADSSAFLTDADASNPSFVMDQPGQYVAQLIVNDGQNDSVPDTVTVSTENARPVADAGVDQQVFRNEVVTLDGNGSNDADGDPLDYHWSLIAFPDTSNAVLSPTNTAVSELVPDLPGNYVAQLQGYDGLLDSAPDTATIRVDNQPPVADAGADQQVALGAQVTLDGSMSSDPEDDPLTFAWQFLTTPAGSGAILTGADSAQATFVADLAGRYTLELSVSDGYDTATATLNVDAQSNAPVITSSPVTGARTGQTYTYLVQASDPDSGDVLTFSLDTSPSGMTIDPTTGAIVWTPDVSQAGTHPVGVRVTDGAGLFDTQAHTLTVQASVTDNTDPQITSVPPIAATTGQAYAYAVTASDADGDPLNFALLSVPSGMTIDTVSGHIDWTPVVSGDYPVAIGVDDGRGGQASQPYILQVEDSNLSPQIGAQAFPSATAGDPYRYEVVASDPDGDPLIYSLPVAPAGMFIDPQSGLIQWTPMVDQVGTQDLTLRVEDAGGLFAEQPFQVAVTRLYRPPVAQDDAFEGLPGDPIAVAAPGVLANDADPDGDPLTAAIVQQPTNGAVNFNPDGSFTYTPTAPVPVPTGLNVQLKWSWTGSEVLPDSFNVQMTPAVIDLNGDAVPDVVFGSSVGFSNWPVGVLRALNGTDGTELFTVSDPALQIYTGCSLTVGDLDNDGRPEIIAASPNNELIAFDHDGTFRWRSPAFPISDNHELSWAALSLADLDADGSPEIIFGRHAVNGDGTLRWSGAAGRGGFYGSISLVADLDLDGQVEVVAGNTAYRANGTIKWQAAIADGYTAVGNFDADPFAEIVVVSNSVTLLEHDGAIAWGPVAIPGGPLGGPPTVADFDGDGQPEIGVASTWRYTVFETDGSIRWEAGTYDTSSATGSSVFDFEGDGSAEVVYRDEDYLRVYRGTDGAVLFETPMTSATWHEYPLVADVDGDGHAEILIGGNQYYNSNDDRGVYVFADAGSGWVPTRKIWNQHTYHVTNVNDDGSIPAREDINWLFPDLNNFRLNTFAPADVALADSFTYRANDGTSDSNEAIVQLVIAPENQPPVFTSAPPLSAVADDLYAYDSNAFDPNTGDRLTWSLSTSPTGMSINPITGFITWTPTAAELGAHDATVLVKDHLGLFATQSFAVTVTDAPPTPTGVPTITSTPSTVAVVGELYHYDVEATDPDGDPLIFGLAVAPTDMTIDPTSGVIQWTPTAAQVGAHNVVVRVEDGTGGFDNQDFSITVTDNQANAAPVITSTPPIVAIAGELYRYDVKATDPDGDPLSIALTTAPTGMNLDRTKGVIEWTPAADQVGDYAVTVEVSDGLAITPQHFSIHVSPPAIALLVPDVVGTTQATAEVALLGAGLRVGAITRANSDTVPAGNVISQSPAAGSSVPEKAAVDLVVSRGPVVAGDTTPPQVSLGAPAADAVLLSAADIVGTVEDANLVGYEVTLARINDQTFTPLASGTTPVVNAVLGQIDPSLLENGMYRIRLSAEDVNGQSASTERVVRIDGEAKVGLFRLSFVDLTVPVSGIPIEVTRTYDSRLKTQEDFGVGWTLGVAAGSYENNRPPGQGWQILEGTGVYDVPCQSDDLVQETLSHVTEIRLSVQEAYTFKLALSGVTRTPGGCFAYAGFEFVDGTVPGATLDIFGDTTVFYQNGTNEVVDLNTFLPFDPPQVRLITADGRVIDLDRHAGITRIADTNGNALNITGAGIVHSSGKSINFTRDGQGRITQITDPLGNTLHYEYDAAGDLVAFVDQEEKNRTDFTYDNRHNLVDIFDPLGNRAVRSEYDEDGRLIATTDAEGNRVEMTHDLANRREAITHIDKDGTQRSVTVHEYDAQGNVLLTIDALGGRTAYTYDERGNKLTVTDPTGVVTTRTYDASNNVLTEKIPLNDATLNAYNARNQIETVTDAAGTTTYGYNAATGNLETLKDPANKVTTMTYYPDGNLQSLSDGGNPPMLFEYDAFGNRIKETDPTGAVTTYTFDANGNEKTRTVHWTDAQGNAVTLTTEYTYDKLGRLVETKNPLNRISKVEYNAIGKVKAEIDVLNRRTEYTYDVRGNRTRVLYPDGIEELTTYDADGNEISKTDRGTRTTWFEYDPLGRLVKTRYPDNTFTETVYDAAGREIAHIDERGFETSYEYDAAGQRVAVADPLGQVTRFEYDRAGRQEFVVDANRNRTQYVYEAGRRTETIFQGDTPDAPSDDTKIVLDYYDDGRLWTKTDQNTHKTTYEYDANGRLTAVIDARSQIDAQQRTTKYSYDEMGNLIAQTDANLHTTRYEYDELGRRTATVLPLNKRATSSYDTAGNLDSTTDFNGITITYDYDPDNDRLLHKHLPEGTVSFTYTATGRKETVTDTRGLTQHDYDDRDRLLSRTDPDNTVISYGYDDAGNRTSVTTPTGTVTYAFDARNQLETVTAPDGLTSYDYDPVGNLLITELPNSTAEERIYDTRNRPTLVRSWNLLSGDPITRFDYTLDAKGNRKVVEELDGRRVEYDYDALDRLTQERIYATGGTTPSRTIGYVYDDVGNRQSRDDSLEGVTTYTYDLNDRLLTETTGGVTTTYGYDDNGNTVSKTQNGTAVTYAWNAENRLTGADTDGDGIDDLQYGYNEDGIRVAKTLGGAETRFLIDANRPYAQVLEELNAAGTSDVSYVYGNDLITQQRSGQAAYYHVDGLGSTRALSDAGGVATDGYTYDAYGQTIERIGFTDNLYQYAGEQRDSALGLDYLRARYLDVRSGRFVSRDTFTGFMQEPISLHRYLYANADPVNKIDPSGLFSLLGVSIRLIVGTQLLGLAQAATLTHTIAAPWRETIKWNAELVTATGSTFSLPNTPLFPVPAGGAAILFAESEPIRTRGGLVEEARGVWVLPLGGLTVSPLPIGFSETSGELISPGFIGLSRLAFTGSVFLFNAAVPTPGLEGVSLTGGFVGFGGANFSGTFSGLDVGLDLLIGWSIPVPGTFSRNLR